MNKLVSKLIRKRKTISNHIGRGNFNPNTARGYDLIDSYEELKEQAIEAGVWIEYCGIVNAVESHDAYDLWA